jgi:hypothetical protein
MGYIRETKLKKGNVRYQAEVRLKGHPTLTVIFDRKTDAKTWISKVEQIFAVAGINSIQRVSVIPLKKPLKDILKNRLFQLLNEVISYGGKKNLGLSSSRMSGLQSYLRKSKNY